MVVVALGSYAQWQLGQASTPRAVLDEVVRRAVKVGIDRAERVLEGYSKEVYRVRCEDQQDLAVRILRFDVDVSMSAAVGETRAIESARAAGVPAPEVLLLDSLRLDEAEFPVMVQRTVPGRPLGEVVTRLSGPRRYDVLAEVGELVARLNGVYVGGECDWPTCMAADLADRQAERDQILAGGFSAPEFDRMLDLVEGYTRDFPCGRWVLCHGDLSLKHIFVTGDGADGMAVRVTGFIDFGDWRPGARVHDLAVLRVHGPQLDLVPLLAGYGAAADETYRRRLDLHTLNIALGALAFSVGEADQTGIMASHHLIRTLVDDLDDPV